MGPDAIRVFGFNHVPANYHLPLAASPPSSKVDSMFFSVGPTSQQTTSSGVSTAASKIQEPPWSLLIHTQTPAFWLTFPQGKKKA